MELDKQRGDSTTAEIYAKYAKRSHSTPAYYRTFWQIGSHPQQTRITLTQLSVMPLPISKAFAEFKQAG